MSILTKSETNDERKARVKKAHEANLARLKPIHAKRAAAQYGKYETRVPPTAHEQTPELDAERRKRINAEVAKAAKGRAAAKAAK